MSLSIPPRPQIPRAKLVALAKKHFPGVLPAVFVVGSPGYFMRSMGNPAKNDRGIYDDAFMIVSPTVYATFNGNTDPAVHRAGVAALVAPQVIWYRPGYHGYGKASGHPAFRQDSPVVVTRDGIVRSVGFRHTTYGISLGDGKWTDEGWGDGERFWTNNHRGGRNATNSLGCLTVPPDQWDAYYALIMSELKRHKQDRFPMILIPGPIN